MKKYLLIFLASVLLSTSALVTAGLITEVNPDNLKGLLAPLPINSPSGRPPASIPAAYFVGIGQQVKQVGKSELEGIQSLLAQVAIPPVPEPPAPIIPPVVANPAPVAIVPSDPVVTLDLPASPEVGKIAVVKIGKSTNICKVLWSVTPAVECYWDQAEKNLIFSVGEPGKYTVEIIASSSTGGIAKVTKPIEFLEASHADVAQPAAVTFRPASTSYRMLIPSLVGQIPDGNRQGDEAAIARAFRGGIAAIESGAVGTKDALAADTKSHLRVQLGSDYDGAQDFIRELEKNIDTEPDDMARLRIVWTDVANALDKESKRHR